MALDPRAADALESLGVSVSPVPPASAGKKGISVPITFGLVSSDTLEGQVRHVGGLKLSAGDTKVHLTCFFIVTLKLTAGAAQALNGAFGTTAFTEGLVVGTATVRARTLPAPDWGW